jgi:GNAT superfamily N-acetyltransferase
VRLRPATESDFPELTRIRVAGISSYASFMPEHWEPPDESDPAERGKARMLDPDHWVTVAEHDDGTILGYVAAGPAMKEWSEGERIPGTAYLWMLFVESAQQRRGVGRTLQESAFEEMQKRGYRRAVVRVAAGAEQARRFYAATGWQVTGTHDDEALGMQTLVAEHPL